MEDEVIGGQPVSDWTAGISVSCCIIDVAECGVGEFGQLLPPAVKFRPRPL